MFHLAGMFWFFAHRFYILRITQPGGNILADGPVPFAAKFFQVQEKVHFQRPVLWAMKRLVPLAAFAAAANNPRHSNNTGSALRNCGGLNLVVLNISSYRG